MTVTATAASLRTPGAFERRHIGPQLDDLPAMLETVGVDSLDTLVAQIVPAEIRRQGSLPLPAAETEAAYLARLRSLAGANRPARFRYNAAPGPSTGRSLNARRWPDPRS